MKNRVKSSKIELGVLFGVPQRFGNVLGASWELPGSVLEPPGRVPVASRIPKGLPTWTPFGAQNPSKIDQKSDWFVYRIVYAISIPKWSQNGPSKPLFFRSKKWWIFRSIFYRFFIDFRPQNQWKFNNKFIKKSSQQHNNQMMPMSPKKKKTKTMFVLLFLLCRPCYLASKNQ